MVNPDSEFVRWVSVVVNPIANVIQELSHLCLDSVALDANVALGGSVSTGPTPHMIEHPAMQAAQESFIDNIALSAKGPLVGFQDVLLLKLVEFVAQGDMRRDQAVAFFWRDGCCRIIHIKRPDHVSSQSRAGRRKSSSTNWRLSSRWFCASWTA